jgi:hypothetical protein
MPPQTATKSRKLNLLEGLTLPNIAKWLGIALLVFVLFTVTYLYAIDPFQKPSDVRVTNMSDRSASISWVTDKPAKGSVVYGEKDSFMPGLLASVGQNIAYDDRDVAKAVLEGAEELEDDLEARDSAVSSSELETDVSVTSLDRYYVHHVTVKGLDPDKDYYFMVGDGVRFSDAQGSFADDEFTISESNSFRTFPELDEVSTPDPSYGKVISDDSSVEAVSDAVLFIRPGIGYDAAPQSSVLNSDGNWYVDLSNTRDAAAPVNTLKLNEDEDSHSVFVEAGMYGESLYVVEPMSADAPMVDITVSNDWEEDEGQDENSFVFKSFAAEEEKKKKKEEDDRNAYKYNENNGKIKKTYADQLVRRANRGDAVSKEDLDQLAIDRPEVYAQINIPKEQEAATGTGPVCNNTSGQPYNTGVQYEGQAYYAYCCSNGYHVPAQCDKDGNNCQVDASEANSACSTRYQNQGSVGLNGQASGGEVKDCPGNTVLCSVNSGAPSCLPRSQCDTFDGESFDGAEEYDAYLDELIWCVPPGRSTDVLISRKSCNAMKGLTVSEYELPSETVTNPAGGGTGQGTGAGAGSEDEEDEENIGNENSVICIDVSTGKKTLADSKKDCTDDGLSYSNDLSDVCKINGVIYEIFDDDECEALRKEKELKKEIPPSIDESCDTPNMVIIYGGESYVCKREGHWWTLGLTGHEEWTPLITESSPTETRLIACQSGDYIDVFPQSYSADLEVCGGTETAIFSDLFKCTNESACVCPDGERIGNGEFCETDVQKGAKTIKVGEVCDGDTSGCLCSQSDGTYELIENGASCQSNNQSIMPGGFGLKLPSVLAQTSVKVSPSEGIFSIEDEGIYCTDYNSEKYCFNISEKGEKFLYIDADGNEKFDEGVDVNIADDTLDLTLTMESTSAKWSLKQGYNFVSFNFVNTSIGTTAKQWLEYLNSRYNDNFYSIAKFESGKWSVVENRDGKTYGTDNFQIMPGVGYLLKSKHDVILSLGGKVVIDSVPVNLQPGWNLISIHGNSSAYTAESLIDDVNEMSGLVSDNVTRWDTSVSRYVGLQKETGAVYGIDFPLSSLDAYFVRVTEGFGVWTPQ